MNKSQTKLYVVKVGRKTGTFFTWADCKKQTDGFSGAVFKSFTDIKAAAAYSTGRLKKIKKKKLQSRATKKKPDNGMRRVKTAKKTYMAIGRA